MRTSEVRCASCGSRLEIPENVRYIACHVCGISLKVHSDQNGLQTTAIGGDDLARPPFREDQDSKWLDRNRGGEEPRRPDAEVRDLARRLDDLELENALLRLDRDWDEDRERYMIRRRFGGRIVPTVERARLSMIICSVIGGLLLMGVAALGISILVNNPGTPSLTQAMGGVLCCFVPPLLPFITILLVIGLASYLSLQRAREYDAAEARYTEERERLLDRYERESRRNEGYRE
jgi:hypothetical protein